MSNDGIIQTEASFSSQLDSMILADLLRTLVDHDAGRFNIIHSPPTELTTWLKVEIFNVCFMHVINNKKLLLLLRFVLAFIAILNILRGSALNLFYFISLYFVPHCL